MKKSILLTVFSTVLFFQSMSSQACYSYYTYERACAGDTVWFHPIDPSAVYCWTFDDTLSGENVSFEQEPYHIFTAPGTYYVTLFTNIGAEWDYYTTAVVITADCFLADYTWDCSGALQVQFTDYSVGGPTTWTWDFGDPGSGTSNSSNLQSPTHSFSSAGTYSVQLIVSDGVQSDTITYSIHVYNSCVDAFFGQTLVLPCYGDTFNPYVSYSGSITGYSWNFGDPSSGMNNTSTLAHPIHVYWMPGIYTITLIINDGAVYDTTYLYVEVVDCRIWPGDVNRDGTVDGDDILGIGIYSGTTGFARPGATSAFSPQTCQDWTGMGSMMYLTEYLNAKQADCDGNGVIDGSDVYVVLNNFGSQAWYANNRSAMHQVPSTAPELGFTEDTIDGWSGATVETPVHLGISDSAKRIYGFSFTIAYDPVYVAYVTADYYFSWLGIPGTTMYTAFVDDNMNGLVHIAGVRNTKTTISGKGEIVRVYFHGYGFPGYSSVEILPSAKVISNGMSSYISNQMVVVPVEIKNADLNFIVGVEEQSEQQARIFPNPADESITIDAAGSRFESVEIIDVLGRCVYAEPAKEFAFKKIIVANLLPGIYTIRAVTDRGLFMGRFMKQ